MRILEQQYDVAVAGGGLCGFAAARACAVAGLKTILIERRPVLGWESTWAFALDFEDPIWEQTETEVACWLRDTMTQVKGISNNRMDAPILEMLLDRELERVGASLLYYAQPVALGMSEQGVHTLVVGSKSGESEILAKAFVDATDNAILWKMAGGEVIEESDRSSFVVFVNGVSDTQPTTITIGTGKIKIRPSVWAGEIAVEFGLSTSEVREGRLAIPDVLKQVRECMGLENAVVTHVAVEPTVDGTCVKIGKPLFVHENAQNLFAAGTWSSHTGKYFPADLLAHGEQCGQRVVEVFEGLPSTSVQETQTATVTEPPLHECDVLVCGGGTAGALAAIAAAREGAKTILLEASTFLGGIGAGGGIHSYYHGITGGLQDEVDDRIKEMTPLFGDIKQVAGFHPEVKKVVLQQMAEEAGVEVIFQTTITGAQTEEIETNLPTTKGRMPKRRLSAVVAALPSGPATFKARVVIDSTGDADVAFMAGVPFTFGRDSDNLPHAYSQAAGRLTEEKRLMITNFDAGFCDPSDLEDITRARRHGVQLYWKEEFKEQHRVVYIAPLLGLRNSRQIQGEYRLTFFDQIASREFPDVIAYARSHYDNHAYDYENENDEVMLWVWLAGNWSKAIGCEIPYRCLLPINVDGLLVACRAMSMTHDAHNQFRMQRDMQRIGEVAGIAAAMAVKADVLPREIALIELQKKLFDTGALGDRKNKELPGEMSEDTEHLPIHSHPRLPAVRSARSVQECIDALEGDTAREAVWDLCRAGESAVNPLLELIESEDKDKRLWAAFALATQGRKEAAAALIECVRERNSGVPERVTKAAPLWMPAMLLLGRVGDGEAVSVLTELLEDADADIEALIGAIRTMNMIGNPDAVPAIEKLLVRDDLPTERKLHLTPPDVARRVPENASWQLHIVAAETLHKFGVDRLDLIHRYLDDERAYVRSYAGKVMERLG